MLFSKKKKAAGSKAQQISPQTDVGMAVIQEFLNRGPGAMKARSGPSTAHILSENDGAVADASTLISMRLTASAKRFRGCSHNWSDSIRQQFNAQQQLLLTRAEKSNYYSMRGESSAVARPRVQALSNVAEDADDTEMHDLQMFSLMADGLQQVGDALFALFASAASFANMNETQ